MHVQAVLIGALLMAAGIVASEAAAAVTHSEDEVKAAFLFHFATYVEWPISTRGDDSITITVLNAPAIAANLEHFVQGRLVQGRAVRVRTVTTLDDIAADEILFIGALPPRRLARLIRSIDSPTLIVTDTAAGLPEGAIINFKIVDQRVRFEISLPAAQNAGLTLSSRLLAAALRVETTRCYNICTRQYSGTKRYVALGR
jgi:hypothetical protein